jgi:hypothetical protein
MGFTVITGVGVFFFSQENEGEVIENNGYELIFPPVGDGKHNLEFGLMTKSWEQTR